MDPAVPTFLHHSIEGVMAWQVVVMLSFIQSRMHSAGDVFVGQLRICKLLVDEYTYFTGEE